MSVRSGVPDFGRAASDYARHRQGFPDRLFEWIGPVAGDVLDIGTGTGLLARELARRGDAATGGDRANPAPASGPGRKAITSMTALDPSADMLAQAAEAAQAQGLQIAHVQAPAEDTGLPDAAFDLITAGTCWHWLDRPAAAREMHRLLRPGGQLIIAHQDWLRRPGNVIDVTLQAIDRWNPPPVDRKWTFQYPDWLFDLTEAGFGTYEVTAFPTQLAYSHHAWVGRIVASAQIGPALTPQQVDAFRAEFHAALTRAFPDEPMHVEHRVFAIRLTRP